MKKYEAKKFNIGELKGISSKAVEEHIKLYEGYVANANSVLEKIEKLKDDADSAYAVSEMQRRFSFEYGGMKNHEVYFGSLEGGAQEPNTDSGLYTKIEEEFGSFDGWMTRIKTIAKTRGVGWAMLVYDHSNERLVNCWVDEQHLGQLPNSSIIVAVDMWEHSFVGDYWPSGKGQYIDDFFENLNWVFVEERFDAVSS